MFNLRIKGKLLLLILLFSLLPLTAVTLLFHLEIDTLGNNLAQRTGKIIAQDSSNYLLHLTTDFKNLTAKYMDYLEKGAQLQAEKLSEYINFASGKPALQIEKLGRFKQMHTCMDNFFKDIFSLHLTCLTSGDCFIHPGGKKLAQGYVCTSKKWFDQAIKDKEPSLHLITHPAQDKKVFFAAVPLQSKDGSLFGVTGVGISRNKLFQGLNLPPKWSKHTRAMLVRYNPEAEYPWKKINIVLDSRSKFDEEDKGTMFLNWAEFLFSQDAEKFYGFLEDIRFRRSGIMQMDYQDRSVFFTYVPDKAKRPFPILMVPEERVVHHANFTEQMVKSKFLHLLKITGLIFLFVAGLAVLVAFLCAKHVSTPITNLVAASRELAKGNLNSAVNIKTKDELQDLGEIFNKLGPTLQEHEKMKQSLALAKEVQQYLLPPQDPEIVGFDIHGMSIYSDETGGDYYDFLRYNEKRLGIAVGDITGHGIGASLLMASARGALRSHFARFTYRPDRLLKTLNQHLCRDTTDYQFLTLFYGILDAEESTLAWASAGHDPAFLYKCREEMIAELPNTGIPLGIEPSAGFEKSGPIKISLGDILLIGTDGIWESKNFKGEMFGRKRLKRILASYSVSSSRRICEEIVKNVRMFTQDAPQRDDITLVVLKAVQDYKLECSQA